ncbi:MAG TPA: DUF3344 domain-containing protein [Methanosarcinales archaeon]|nr:MAG: hypothetical protein DRO03_00830 [Methanosarcinales archaeon]HDN65187.1 DUF3344 domain-containing protein [Methanosarcinales archaeon]
MKILHALLILTITSTAGALLPGNGLAAPETSFLVYGWVDYNNGASVNDLIIEMTNANTGKTFDVETNSGSNYYQVLTDSDNIDVDDVLHFRAGDGGTLNTAEFDHVVSELQRSEGGFERNITIGAPDLVVESITLNPDCSSAGAAIFVNKANEIQVNVGNIGVSNATGAFDVCFAVDGTQIGCATISSGLSVDQSETVTITWTPDCAKYAPDSISTGKPITLTATADGNTDIAEEDETNNGLLKEDASVYVNGFASKNFDCDTEDPLTPLTGYEGVEMYGGVAYNVSGKMTNLAADTSITRVHHIAVPDGMTVEAARLYLYWYDSSDTPPGSQASFDVDVAGTSYSTPGSSYIDQVPFASSGNTPKGTYVYDVTAQVTGTGDYAVKVSNIQSSGTATLYGGMLLVIYDDPTENPDNRMKLWITEGFDILNAWQCYCVSTEEATATVTFSGAIDTTEVTSATLVTVVTPEKSHSNLLINSETVVSDAWNVEAYPGSKVCVDERDISANLKASDNTVGFERDRHTPIYASNAVLMVRGTSGVALPGDINGDGTVTTDDAAIAMQMAASGEYSDVADVSGDGEVTSLDALMILQKAAS